MKKQILLSHGGGGEEMNSLINDTIFKAFDNEILRRANDSAILNFPLDLDKNFDIISANFGDKTDYFNEKSQNFDISNLNGQKKTDKTLENYRYEKGTSDKEQRTNKRQKNQKQNIRELYEFTRREL